MLRRLSLDGILLACVNGSMTQNRYTLMNRLCCFLAIGTGIVSAGCGLRQQQPSVSDTPTGTQAQRLEAPALEGNWTMVSVTMAGKSSEETRGTLAFVGDKMIMKSPAGETTTNWYRIEPLSEPRTIELTDRQNTNAPPRFAIFELEGQRLRLCFGGEGKRPAAFGADGRPIFLFERK